MGLVDWKIDRSPFGNHVIYWQPGKGKSANKTNKTNEISIYKDCFIMAFPWNMFRLGIWFWDRNLGWWYDDFPGNQSSTANWTSIDLRLTLFGNDSKFNPWNGHGFFFWWFWGVDNFAILEFQMMFFVFHRIAWRCHLCSSHQWRGVMVKADVANRGLFWFCDRGRVPGDYPLVN